MTTADDRPRCVRPGDISRLTGASANAVSAIAGHIDEDIPLTELPRELRTRAAEHDALARREKSDAKVLRQWAEVVERRTS